MIFICYNIVKRCEGMTAYDKVDDAIRDYKEKVDRLYTASG